MLTTADFFDEVVARYETSPPYSEEVYMFPTLVESKREGLVFDSKSHLLAPTKGFSRAVQGCSVLQEIG